MDYKVVYTILFRYVDGSGFGSFVLPLSRIPSSRDFSRVLKECSCRGVVFLGMTLFEFNCEVVSLLSNK